MNRGLFLDRDGVVNIERGTYTWKIEDWKYKNHFWELLHYAQGLNFLIFIVTNQSGIAKGFYSVEDVLHLHQKIYDDAEERGISISEIVFCPHHPEISKCLCRKPQTLLFEKLIAKYKICTACSVCIGDSERDLVAAKKVGLQTIGINLPINTYIDFSVQSLEEIILHDLLRFAAEKKLVQFPEKL